MQLINPKGEELKLSLRELEDFLQFEWLTYLQFSSAVIAAQALGRAASSIRRKELSRRERWLGTHFEKEVLAGTVPPVYFKWIDSIMGYGVFASRAIPSGIYIGEYTGVIRKRRRWKDRTNHYTFEYTIGDWAHNPYIIDAKEKGNHTRFINHDPITPNLETLSVFAGGLMHIIFMTQEAIQADEQLGYDYGDIFWKNRMREVMPLY